MTQQGIKRPVTEASFEAKLAVHRRSKEQRVRVIEDTAAGLLVTHFSPADHHKVRSCGS
jgi:hypothetical protein